MVENFLKFWNSTLRCLFEVNMPRILKNSTCEHYDLWILWLVNIMTWGHYDLWTLWIVNIRTGVHWDLWTLLIVNIISCEHFEHYELWTVWIVTFIRKSTRFVTQHILQTQFFFVSTHLRPKHFLSRNNYYFSKFNFHFLSRNNYFFSHFHSHFLWH